MFSPRLIASAISSMPARCELSVCTVIVPQRRFSSAGPAPLSRRFDTASNPPVAGPSHPHRLDCPCLCLEEPRSLAPSSPPILHSRKTTSPVADCTRSAGPMHPPPGSRCEGSATAVAPLMERPDLVDQLGDRADDLDPGGDLLDRERPHRRGRHPPLLEPLGELRGGGDIDDPAEPDPPMRRRAHRTVLARGVDRRRGALL